MTPTALLGSDPYTQAVYSAIKSHFPRCFPSIKRIAQLAGCSHVTVIRRLTKLKAMGMIIVHKGKRGQSNKYEIPDNYLTEKERAAKAQGSWKNISWKSVFFGSKKAVNLSKPKTEKVVNHVTCNKNNFEQEAKYISWKQAISQNPELQNWFKRSFII
jgi:DNA-binding transcriptional MocR family regulator